MQSLNSNQRLRFLIVALCLIVDEANSTWQLLLRLLRWQLGRWQLVRWQLLRKLRRILRCLRELRELWSDPHAVSGKEAKHLKQSRLHERRLQKTVFCMWTLAAAMSHARLQGKTAKHRVRCFGCWSEVAPAHH